MQQPRLCQAPKLSGEAFQACLGWVNNRAIPLGPPLLYSRMHVNQVSKAFDILISCYEAENKLRDDDFKDIVLGTIIQLTMATRIFIKQVYKYH